MDNLRKFNTEADYSSATLNYPSVSWVVSGDTVHYDKSKTMPKVRMAAATGGLSVAYNLGLSYYNTSINFNAIVVDGVSIANPNETRSITNYPIPTGAEYVYVDYYFDEDAIDGVFSDWIGVMGEGSSDMNYAYMLFGEGVTAITNNPANNISHVIFEGTTPPSVGNYLNGRAAIYVPDDYVNTYKAAWPDDASRIYPRSQCSVAFPNI